MNTRDTLSATVLAVLILTAGCTPTKIPTDKRDAVRSDIDRREQSLLARSAQENTELQQLLNSSAGYIVTEAADTGKADADEAIAHGVLVDTATQSRTYVRLPAQNLSDNAASLLVFDTPEQINKFLAGEAATCSVIPAAATDAGVQLMSGAAAGSPGGSDTAGIQSVQQEVDSGGVDNELNLDRVSAFFAGVDFDSFNMDAETEDDKWKYTLPFFHHWAGDSELPLPMGIGISYTNLEQDISIRNVKADLGGGLQPTDAAEFIDPTSNTASAQIKADAWLLPFLNVFATLGHVDGDSDIHVDLDGNTLLAEAGINCNQPGLGPVCDPLQDKIIPLTQSTEIEGTSYGVGMVLSLKRNNLYGALPFSTSWLDLKDNPTGRTYSFNPRVGYIFKSVGWEDIFSVYTGANYLKTDVTVTGTFSIPGSPLSAAYELDQENQDKWNTLIGASWSHPNKHWSLTSEIHGINGSRDVFMTTLTYRFGIEKSR